MAYAYGQQQLTPQGNPNQEGGTSTRVANVSSSSGLPGTIKIGGWVHTGLFADQRINQQGGLLGVSGGLPYEHRSDYAVYGVIDQMLWRVSENSDRGLNLFLRATAVPSDRNLIDLYMDGGFNFKGLFAARAQDTAGLAVAFAHVSGQAAASAQDMAASGMPMPIPNFEIAIEATYQWQLADNWFVQPDLQYIIHPGGHIANPIQPSTAIPNALVFGTRMVVRF